MLVGQQDMGRDGISKWSSDGHSQLSFSLRAALGEATCALMSRLIYRLPAPDAALADPYVNLKCSH